MPDIVCFLICYCPFAAAWAFWKKKTRASVIPLFIGMIAYLSVIFPRYMLRMMVGYEELRQNSVWQFYFTRGVISGSCEEFIRLAVFIFLLKKADSWIDCVSYGAGHGVMEIILISRIKGNDLIDCLLVNYDLLLGICFSTAMSVLVYAAAVHAEDKKLLFAALGLHFLIDFIPAFYDSGMCGLGAYMLADLLLTAGCVLIAYRVYGHYRLETEGQDAVLQKETAALTTQVRRKTCR